MCAKQRKNAVGAGILVKEAFPLLILALDVGLGRCCCSSPGSLVEADYLVKAIGYYKRRCVARSTLHLLSPSASKIYCLLFLLPQIAGSFRSSYFSMTGLLISLLGCSWLPLPSCLPSLSPFMIPLLGCSWLPLPPCLPSLSPFMISLLGCSCCRCRLVSQACLPE